MRQRHLILWCGVTAIVSGVALAVQPGIAAEVSLAPTSLRCEYLVNPLGMDVEKPRLSWVLESDMRGQKQTAYRILVAQSETKLAHDQGDLWDSGKVGSAESVHVVYAGKPLLSRMSCYWKVQVWDTDNKASAWSQPAHWSMGLLRPDDWHAQWIAHPKAAQRKPSTPHNGYHSQLSPQVDAPKWVAIDLGKTQQIDAVRLYPARPFDWSQDVPGFLFPLRFKIEVAPTIRFVRCENGRGPDSSRCTESGYGRDHLCLCVGYCSIRTTNHHPFADAGRGQLRLGAGRDASSLGR